MNKKAKIFMITELVFIVILGFILYQNNKEIEKLKAISENYAKENESLKADLEMLRKKLMVAENSKLNSSENDFARQQKQQFKSLREEIQRLKSEKTPENREKEDQIWDYTLEKAKNFLDAELMKKLASLGFKPEETEVCVTEYNSTLDKSKELVLQWYRNEITDGEYEEKILDLSRDFYDDISKNIGENLASIMISVVFPDYEFRKKMFEEK